MLNLIIFSLQVFQHRCLLDDVVGKFLPLHVSVPVYVNLVEEVGKVSHQAGLSIRKLDLPEPEMLGGNGDELL